jgi:hypothetical protein
LLEPDPYDRTGFKWWVGPQEPPKDSDRTVRYIYLPKAPTQIV